MPELVFQGVANGLVTGGIYMLIAVGLALIFGTMRLANFAHGDMLMVGMYAVFFAVTMFGWNIYATVVVAVPLLFAMGVLTYVMAVRPVISSPPEALLLNMIGFSLILENAALIAFGASLRSLSDPFSLGALHVSAAILGYAQLVAALASLVAVGVVVLILHRTEIGRAIRATSEDREAAQAAGIDINRVNAISFGLGAGCLGVAAPLVMPFFSITPTVGLAITLIGFLIIVMGGLGSFRGAVIAAIIVGVTEGIGGVLFQGANARALLYSVFVAVLVFRPTGLFGVQRL